MSVSLLISKTLTGGAVSDPLAGGSTGLNLGQTINGEFAPILDQGSNLGHQDLYISHDATIDPIRDFSTYVGIYSGVYGGANSAAADIATLIAKGQADNEATANNSDGFSSGLRIEHAGINIGSLGASAFLPSRAQVSIYGNNGTDGIDLASAFDLHVDALVYDNAGVEQDASAPQTGEIGIIGDSTLGDHAHIGLRFYLEEAAPDGGILQYDFTLSYSFTA
jgi:hypothetical protein